MVWWQKSWREALSTTCFPIDPALDWTTEQTIDPDRRSTCTTNEDEVFREAVENFMCRLEDSPFPWNQTRKTEEEKETDELLKEISELLRDIGILSEDTKLFLDHEPTKHPLCKIRLSLLLPEVPRRRQREEVDVYQILKTQLTLLISQIPTVCCCQIEWGPNGRTLHQPDYTVRHERVYRGVLEEDQLSRLAKTPIAASSHTGLSCPIWFRERILCIHREVINTVVLSRLSHQSGARPVYAQPAVFAQIVVDAPRSVRLQEQLNLSKRAVHRTLLPLDPGFPSTPSFNQHTPTTDLWINRLWAILSSAFCAAW